jgi:hypothetical protein
MGFNSGLKGLIFTSSKVSSFSFSIFQKNLYITPVSLFSVDCVCNVMAHAQKPDFVFRRKGRVHLNRQGRQFSRILAAEVWASVVINAGYTIFRDIVKGIGCPLQSPVSSSLPFPCVTVCRHVSAGLYHILYQWKFFFNLFIKHAPSPGSDTTCYNVTSY